jgi:tRNA/tmRNA/rRNA uracil-C5-methylase (TrmA/RlmC/RlmD family)
MVPFRLQETLTIEKLVYGGEGLSRLEGKVVLTPFVLPGEVVRAEIERAKNDLWRGRLIEVLQPSAFARDSRMPVFPALRRLPVSAHRLCVPVGAEARDSA